MTPDATLASWVDGKPQQLIELQCRGLQYGDGVFRTLLVSQGRAMDQRGQLEHLRADADALGLTAPPLELLEAELENVASRLRQGVLRYTLCAGDTPRGYARDDAAHVRRILQASAAPAWPEANWHRGVEVASVNYRLSEQPRLAGIKHLNRLDQVLARRSLAADYPEGLLCDQSGHLVSGIMSNVFWWCGERWFTPEIERCGVAGRTRARLMRGLKALGETVQRARTQEDEVRDQARLIVLCNSVIGIWPVRSWQHWHPAEDANALAALARLRKILDHPYPGSPTE